MKLAVLSDFDGTITLNDTFEDILAKFAEGDWRAADDQYVRGLISLEECVQRQGAMVKVSPGEMLGYLNGITKFRPNFDSIVQFCNANRFPLVIVSAGLSFVIKHFLTREGFEDKVELFAAVASCTPTGIEFEWPKLKNNTSFDFKEDTVRYYKQRADVVAYIGDGRWDVHALRKADRRFVVRNSKLADLSKKEEIQTTIINDFQDVLTRLQKEILYWDSTG